ncbi:MAG TPA: HD-GYP domain-containing protein [Novimethylophilus sp.]|jgi:putative nucleotidyltransferase with HDIG domain|uniref:HD-GYP domain-containing protein n=1 Tax=Novimethylophilus sp. TaxID=2137426 RepID=UPI002F42AF29
MDSKQHFIEPAQLRIGIYVHLDLGWMDHPFTFNNFKIRNEKQLEEVRSLGLKKLRYDPLRSDCEPLPAIKASPSPRTPPAAEPLPAQPSVTQRFHTERLKQLHHAIHECEQKFVAAAHTVRQVTRNFRTQAAQAVQESETLVNAMVESVLTESDVVLHAMNGHSIAEETYVHSLNVSVLALVLAKSLNMTAEEARHLGMAAIFHDIGKEEIPDRILMKTEPLTKVEQSFYQQHAEIGAKLALEAGLPERIATIILQHHEHVDGSGYPHHLKQAQIDPLARLTSIVNTYDNLCNPLNSTQSMTPYEALSHLFATQRNKFDSAMLKLLIKCLGVYPPGSIVYLSTGVHGIVMSVNPSKPLRPFVMLHVPEVPREEPMVLDLSEEPGITITKCLRANQLPNNVAEYLSPRKRISYYFDKDKPADAG